MILSILICTIEDRRDVFKETFNRIASEVFLWNKNMLYEATEVLFECDNREMSVGAKRQKLLNRAKGKFIVFLDDDDKPSSDYVGLILRSIIGNPDIDCIGIRGVMTTNGSNPKTWVHRLGLPIEGDGITPTTSGFDYTRPIIHFNPVLREKALQAGFKDMRYGEDMDYASRLNPLLTKEYFIDQDLFHYRYSDLVPHDKKYGIGKFGK